MVCLSRVLAGAFAAILITAGVASAAAPTGEAIDGIRCDHEEGAVFHIHQHLAIFDRGRPVDVPDDIGRPIAAQCFYWLHTHTPNGIIHVESPTFRTYTLGQFFDVWGEPLSATRAASARTKADGMRVYVDGRIVHGDPRKIELAQHTDITIEVGPPYRTPQPFADWQGQ